MMSKQTASLLSTAVVLLVIYHFRNQLVLLWKELTLPKCQPGSTGACTVNGFINPVSFAGSPTPGFAAGTTPIALSAPGNVGELFGGFGAPPAQPLIPVSTGSIGVSNQVPSDGSVVFIASGEKNPNSPSGGLGITGYD